MSLQFRSAASIAEAVRDGDLDPLNVVDGVLDRIERRNDVTNAYVTVLAEDARERAREVRERLDDGETLPLAGVPVAMKDLSESKAGVRQTMGMKPLAENVAEETSVTIRRLEEAGAIVVGTTNTPELGHRVRTDNMLVGPTGTPFDPERNAGGSSGGSAAALADGLCSLATGSDVGGSLRNPAACCGVVSVKPTHGLVPRGNRINGYRGHTPVAVLGPMARDVESLALMLDVLAGPDPIDPFSVPKIDEYAAALEGEPDPDDLSLAYSPDLDLFPVEPAVSGAVESTLSKLEAAGATVEEITLDTPDRSDINQSYLVAVTTFFATSVAELDEQFGTEILDEYADEVPEQLGRLVEVGRSHDTGTYGEADFARTDLYHAVEEVLTEYDALVCPTLATPPLTHEEPLPTEIDGETTNGMPTDWTLAWPFNLTGHPVVNVPAETVDGLPIGMQLVGRPFEEAELLEIAATIEATAPWSYPDA